MSNEKQQGYRVVYEGGQGEYVEKKSHFIATVRPVESEKEATDFINEIKKKYWDARHNCSAFVIGENHELTRCSDDGEPADDVSCGRSAGGVEEVVRDACVNEQIKRAHPQKIQTERNNDERRAEQNDRRMKEKLPNLLFPAKQDDVCEDQPADRCGIRDAEHQQHAETYAIYKAVPFGVLAYAPAAFEKPERETERQQQEKLRPFLRHIAVLYGADINEKIRRDHGERSAAAQIEPGEPVYDQARRRQIDDLHEENAVPVAGEQIAKGIHIEDHRTFLVIQIQIGDLPLCNTFSHQEEKRAVIAVIGADRRGVYGENRYHGSREGEKNKRPTPERAVRPVRKTQIEGFLFRFASVHSSVTLQSCFMRQNAARR